MNTMQKGIPLNDQTLGNMTPEEGSFWNSFMAEAMEELERCKMAGATQPFTPSEYLRDMFQIAITKYDGEKYCQTRQLKEIFNFNPATS